MPEGDFRLGAELNAAVTEASTDTAAFVVADLSKKLAQASRILMQKTKADADLRVKSATEKLSLSERLRRADAKVLALRDENSQLKGKCTRLEATARDNEKVLKNLQKMVENDANEKQALKGKVKELEAVQTKVAELEGVFTEVAARADTVYQEYRMALAALGAEPLPLPELAEGPQVFISAFGLVAIGVRRARRSDGCCE